ncbi:MAG: alpha/beta hydrolase, partial [Pseudomonadota bacterium]
MTDFSHAGLDPEIAAFVDRTLAHYPADTAERNATVQRRAYDSLCRAFDAALPEGIGFQDRIVPGEAKGIEVPVRIYHPPRVDRPDTLVLYMHGGGFVVGGLHSHHGVCAELTGIAGCALASVDYRLAPEHVHPAQFEDCRAAFRHFAARYERIVVAGDSAGGNLAAAVCVALREAPARPVGAVLIYPSLGGDQLGLDSYARHADAPMLTAADIVAFNRLWHGGPKKTGDPSSAPLLADSFAGHPSTAIFSAAIDPLCDDGPEYARRLTAAGIPAACHVEDGLVHGYLRARAMSRLGRAAFARI